MADQVGAFLGAATASYMNTRKRGRDDDEGTSAPDAGGSSSRQIVTSYHSRGRPVSHARLFNRLSQLNRHYFIQYFGEFSKYGNSSALTTAVNSSRSFKLFHTNGSSTLNGNLPVHMYDLTTRFVDTVPTMRSVCYSLQQSFSAPNNLVWDINLTRGKDQNGADTNFVCPYKSDMTEAGSYVAMTQSTKTILAKTEIDLLLQGVQGMPCTINVAVVHFEDERLDPNYAYYEGGNTGSQEANKWYWDIVRKGLVNPIMSMPGPLEMYGRAKILDKWKFRVDPSTTTDYDVCPGQHKVTLRYFHNKTMNWDWTRRSDQVAYGENLTVKFKPVFAENSEQAANYLKREEDRQWLMVWATNYQDSPVGQLPADVNCPQYDMVIRQTHILSYE